MIKVLIVGLSEEIGGIENLFYNLFKNGAAELAVDFLAFGDGCAYEKEFISLGYNVFHMPTRKSSFLKFNSIVKAFLLEHNEYDYIWFNTASTSMYQFQYYGKKYTQSKIITHSHGTSIDRNNGTLLFIANKFLERINRKKVTNNTDLFFCCSLAAGVALFGKQFKDRLIMIKNGINVSQYKYSNSNRTSIRSTMGINFDTVVIAMIGRLSVQKNPIKGIEIFNEYHKINPNSILLIVGEGDLRNEVETRISELGISEKVKMLGFRNDIGSVMSCSDILLMPSLFEGLPLTAIEAECNGLTCFLSDTITCETKLIGECYFVPLQESNQAWAKEIAERYSPINEREKYYQYIVNEGYSIEQTRIDVMKLLQGE